MPDIYGGAVEEASPDLDLVFVFLSAREQNPQNELHADAGVAQ
jgi:hypothetical protein